MKNCSKCYIEKPLSSFYKRKNGSRTGEYYNYCIDCYKIRGRNYYHANRIQQSKLANNRRKKYSKILREFVNKQKENIPCMDCGGIFPPYVMDFDHRDPSQKISNVSKLNSGRFYTIEKLVEEIKKCDLVCANCHRIRTFNYLQSRQLQ